MNSILQDLAVVRRLTFAASSLPVGTPHYWDIVSAFSIKGKKGLSLTGEEARIFVDNLKVLNPHAFDMDIQLADEIIKTNKSHKAGEEKIGKVLISSKEKCNRCGSKLNVRVDRSVAAVIYDHLGTVPAIHYTKYCRKIGCSLQQHYGYYTFGGDAKVYYDDDCLDLPYFMCSRETAFSVEILKKYDVECLIGQVSYMQCADIYNSYHGYEGGSERFMERIKMDRRRLENAHIRYAILTVSKWYPDHFSCNNIAFTSDTASTLLEFTPLYQEVFHQTYSAHRCTKSGCGSVLVIDGNMKNHRAVCAASDAGYIDYTGLSSTIKSGCTNTPEQKSRFCSDHKPRALACTSDTNGVIEMILEKKTTRSMNHYKVLWLGRDECSVSWEKESDIPAPVLEEFKAQVHVETSQRPTQGIGQASYIVNVVPIVGDEPTPKRCKKDRMIINGDTGIFAPHANDIENLQCNTEKDNKGRLHNRSAGLLAGIWPCGIITIVDELYKTESKSQVYGCLHGFIHSNPLTTQDISVICYDDGCHLRKYARNSTRANITDAAQKLSQVEIVVDKMHFKNHIDNWCRLNCNPYTLSQLDKVDTEICEQTFSWLSRYGRITRYMNKPHYAFYLLYLCDLHNRRQILTK